MTIIYIGDERLKFNLKETEKAYIAGFFDGEGHVSIQKKKPNPPRWKNPSYKLVATITNTNEGIVEAINGQFQFTGHKHGPYKQQSNFKHGKPIFQLTFTGSDCQEFLKAILPYVIVKHKQAEVALNFNLLGERTCPNKGLTESDLREREHFYQLLKHLNHKGVD